MTGRAEQLLRKMYNDAPDTETRLETLIPLLNCVTTGASPAPEIRENLLATLSAAEQCEQTSLTFNSARKLLETTSETNRI